MHAPSLRAPLASVITSSLVAILMTTLVGCGSSTTTPGSDTTDGAIGDDTSGTDTSTTPDVVATDAPSADASGAGDAGDATMVDAACTTSCATLAGKVLRVALTKPQNGGKGTVYVAVFDKDPVIDRAGAKVVGMALVPGCDLTSDTASVPYSIAGLATRADPYFVVAFLDDNKNASATAPGPDKGDLVSLDGIGAPKVTIAKAGTVALDIPLNAVLPF